MTRHTHDEPMPWMNEERPHHLWTSADIAQHNRQHVAPLAARMAKVPPAQIERRAPHGAGIIIGFALAVPLWAAFFAWVLT